MPTKRNERYSKNTPKQERLVSVDFNHTVQSCILASEQTRVVDKTMVPCVSMV